MPPKPASTRAGTKIGIVQACHLKQKGGEKQTSQGRETGISGMRLASLKVFRQMAASSMTLLEML